MKAIITLVLFLSVLVGCTNGKENKSEQMNNQNQTTDLKELDSADKTDIINSDNQSSEEMTTKVDSLNYQDYVFELYKTETTEGEYNYIKMKFTGYKNGKKIVELESETPYLEMTIKGKDINGNSIPDIVLTNYTGGAHCCFEMFIFELGKKFKQLVELSGDNEPRLEDLDDDGIPEIIHSSSVFTYWHVSFAGSYLPQYVLKFKDGSYRLAKELMKKPAPDDSSLRQVAANIKLDDTPWGASEDFFEDPALFARMLELIFAGNIDAAWKFLDYAWPETKPGKEKFKEDFIKQLSTFEYWDELKKW